MRSDEVVYIKQFKIAHAEKDELNKYVEDLLKLGVVEKIRVVD